MSGKYEIGREWGNGSNFEDQRKKLYYFINFKGLIAVFESLRNILKNGINF